MKYDEKLAISLATSHIRMIETTLKELKKQVKDSNIGGIIDTYALLITNITSTGTNFLTTMLTTGIGDMN